MPSHLPRNPVQGYPYGQTAVLNTSHQLANGLLGYWIPNGSGFMRSLTAGVANGTQSNDGAIQTTTTGSLAVGSTSTNQKGSLPNAAPAQPTAAMTIAVGVTQSASGNFLFSCENSGSTAGGGCYNANNAAAPHLYFLIGAGFSDVQLPSIVPEDGTVHHLAMTYDGTTFRVYQDGVAGSTAAASGAVAWGANVIALGAKGDGTLGSASAISYFAIYGRALSAGEIRWLSASPYAMLSPSPMRNYRGGATFPNATSRVVIVCG